MTIQKLREARNKAWEGAKAFVESKRDKDGLLSAEDAAAYAKMEQKIKDYGAEIERMEQMAAMEAELNKPVNTPLTSRPSGSVGGAVKTGRASDEYKAAMLDAIRSGFKRVSNVLQEGVDADGGYLVPEEYDRRLIDVLDEENIMRSLATRITTSGEHKINIAATKPAASWIEEGGGTVAGTLTAAIKSDDMLDLVYALKRPYRKSASFIMNDKTLLSLRKLKDNNGQYIWQPSYQVGEPDRVLGYAVHTSAYAPENAIAFGDYKYYNIGDRGTRSFKQLNELFAGNGMIGYVAKERVDGKLILPEAVQILKLKADTPSGE